jgi:hypothetical protein
MLAAAYDTEVDSSTRLTRLHEARQEIADMLGSDWVSDPSRTTRTLRSIGAYACEPSLATLISDEPHTLEVAAAVTDNLRAPFATILSSELSNFAATSQRPDCEDIKGALSELAVLAVSWSSVEIGHLQPQSYTLPATQREDRGAIRGGQKTGYDFVLTEKRGQQYIQVKTADPRYPSLPQKEAPKHKSQDNLQSYSWKTSRLPYRKNICVVKPSQLLGPSAKNHNIYASLLLMDSVVQQDERGLAIASSALMKRLAAVRKQMKRHALQPVSAETAAQAA